MATNPYIRLRPNRERNLVSDLHKEMIRNFGIDVEYMVRDEVSVDKIFGEDTRSKFSTSRKIEMYVESADGFEGSDVILGQIGLEIDQTAEFTVSIERFREVFDDLNFLEPREGDVLYIRFAEDDTRESDLGKSEATLWEIMKVNRDYGNFQLGRIHSMTLTCKKMRYSYEQLMTGTTEIDEIQDINTKVPDFDLLIMGRPLVSGTAGTFFEGEEVQQGDTFSGTIVNWDNGTNRLTIFGASGSPETTSGVTGVSSGAYALFSATGPASIAAVGVTANLVDVDGFSDNETLEREASSFLDFTDVDPFSEGDL
jgi:hypothetical protein